MSYPLRESSSTSVEIIPILVVDDHIVWRAGLSSIFEGSEFEVVAGADNLATALAAASAFHPRIVLLDIRLAKGDGLEVLSALTDAFPDIRVVILTTYTNPTFVARAVAGGAVGYMLKETTPCELLETLRCVMRGENRLESRAYLRSLNCADQRRDGSDNLYERLSKREIEVLRLLGTGLTNRDIARILSVAEGTIKSHLEHILGKLGIQDRVQAAVWAAREGLLPGGTNS